MKRPRMPYADDPRAINYILLGGMLATLAALCVKYYLCYINFMPRLEP